MVRLQNFSTRALPGKARVVSLTQARAIILMLKLKLFSEIQNDEFRKFDERNVFALPAART